jgi:hypothetical protein
VFQLSVLLSLTTNSTISIIDITDQVGHRNADDDGGDGDANGKSENENEGARIRRSQSTT